MDRRNFLRCFVAAGAVPFVGWPASEPLGQLMRRLRREAMGPEVYYVTVHPSVQADFVSVVARGRWLEAFRAWRKDGKPGMTAKQIFDKYAYEPPPLTGEFGTIDGFRFIASETVLG